LKTGTAGAGELKMKLEALVTAAMIVLLTMLGGCASTSVHKDEKRIDGSSRTATSNSLKQLSESLPGYERCLLQAAILRIQLGDADTAKIVNASPNENNDPLGAMINGMSYRQILDLSQRYPDKAGHSCKP
jgi:hypothetical protein